MDAAEDPRQEGDYPLEEKIEEEDTACGERKSYCYTCSLNRFRSELPEHPKNPYRTTAARPAVVWGAVLPYPVNDIVKYLGHPGAELFEAAI